MIHTSFKNLIFLQVLKQIEIIIKNEIILGVGRKNRGSSSRQTDSRIRRKISQDIRRSSQGSSQGMSDKN